MDNIEQLTNVDHQLAIRDDQGHLCDQVDDPLVIEYITRGFGDQGN